MKNPLLLFALLASLMTSGPANAMDKTYSWLETHIHVSTKGSKLTIASSGAMNNSNVTVDAPGKVVWVKLEDLDANGLPEIYVFFKESGKNAYGRIIAYAATNTKGALCPIVVPELTSKQAVGYSGHDEFVLVEGNLLRRFPIQGGKTRLIHYQLRRDGAQWSLKAAGSVDF